MDEYRGIQRTSETIETLETRAAESIASARFRIDASESTCCPVCGSRNISRDAVLEQGLLQLAECRRCDQRWTWREPQLFVGRAVRSAAVQVEDDASPGLRVAREVQSAA